MSTNGPAQRRYIRTSLQPQAVPPTDRHSTHREARKSTSRESCAGPTFPPPRQSSRFQAGATVRAQPVPQHIPRKVVKPSPVTKQPRGYQADSAQWDNLRSQGYVLRGSVSMPTIAQEMLYQPKPAIETPNIRYVPDPTYQQPATYQVHPNLRTTPHLAQPAGHPAPEAAFLSQARFAPPPQQATPYPPTPQRPKLHSQASSITMRTLRAQQDSQKCQLKPGNIFLYERPSKASYLENEEMPSRCGPPRPPSRAASAHGSHNEGRSSSRLSRHSASLPFIPFQPDYPPTEPLHASLNLPSRPASRIAQSTPLIRQETDMSFYSQSTFPDSYTDMVQHSRTEALSRASTRRSTQSAASGYSYPLETTRTEISLGTAQDLWRDLYHELLSSGELTEDPNYASLQTPRPPDIEATIDVEYDFRHQTMALRSPSPVPIQRLKSTKKVRDSGSHTRPSLVRQSPVRRSYEDTARQVIERAMKAASTDTSPKKPAKPALSTARWKRDREDDAAHAHQSVVSIPDDVQAVGSLTRQLRAKTPAAEVFEECAMQQLTGRTGWSEVDSEDDCLVPPEATTSTASEEEPTLHIAAVTSPVMAQGTLTKLSTISRSSQAIPTQRQRIPVSARASRIPVPTARKGARPR